MLDDSDGPGDAGERVWARDRQRFVEDARRAWDEGRAPLADHGYRLGPLAREFAVLTYSLLDAVTVAEVLEQVVSTTAQLVTGADVVAVTLRDKDGRFNTPVTTDPVAARLDQLQDRLREGPCWEAAKEPGPAVATSTDLATEARWRRFGPAAAAEGVCSVACTALLPARESTAPPGALSVYSRRPGGLEQADQHVMLLLATHASLAVARSQAVEIGELRAAHLRTALNSRDVIGQAKGILMARQNIDAAAAFDILRRTSQGLNTKLVELAETLTRNHSNL